VTTSPLVNDLVSEYSAKPKPADPESALHDLAICLRDDLCTLPSPGARALKKIADAWAFSVSVDTLLKMMKPRPAVGGGDGVPVPVVSSTGPDGSEGAIAEYLAGTDLNQRLRWRAGDHASSWFEWTGTHWQATSTGIPLAIQVEVRRAVASGIEGRRIEIRGVHRLGTASAMRGIAACLVAWPTMQMLDDLDPAGLLAVPAGVIDLATGEPLRHDPARAITRCCPVDPDAGCELWPLVEAHLRSCLGELYNAFHRLLGSSLLGRSADRRMVWLHGPGGDGKSTFAKLLRAALGDFAAIVPAEVFGVNGARGAHLHELGASMAGSRLAISLEVPARLDWAKLKGLSGGDEQKTKRLHGRSFYYDRPPVVVLISNEKPTPPDRAIAERLVVAELSPPVDPDERIMAALHEGGPRRKQMAAACLDWLMRGCTAFLAEGGLGPVPLYAFSPVGLERWWADAVNSGRIVPGEGWSPLADAHADLKTFAAADGWKPPHEREIAAFLRTVVNFKRTNEGRKYAFRLSRDAS